MQTAKRPWCWYCDREFDDEKVLIVHQKTKHFKCMHCHRKLNSASGLVIHVAQIHKETITRVPNSIPEHDTPELEIFGMEGVPADDLARHYEGLPVVAFKRIKISDASLLPLLAAQKASIPDGKSLSELSIPAANHGATTAGFSSGFAAIPSPPIPPPSMLASAIILTPPSVGATGVSALSNTYVSPSGSSAHSASVCASTEGQQSSPEAGPTASANPTQSADAAVAEAPTRPSPTTSTATFPLTSAATQTAAPFYFAPAAANRPPFPMARPPGVHPPNYYYHPAAMLPAGFPPTLASPYGMAPYYTAGYPAQSPSSWPIPSAALPPQVAPPILSAPIAAAPAAIPGSPTAAAPKATESAATVQPTPPSDEIKATASSPEEPPCVSSGAFGKIVIPPTIEGQSSKTVPGFIIFVPDLDVSLEERRSALDKYKTPAIDRHHRRHS